MQKGPCGHRHFSLTLQPSISGHRISSSENRRPVPPSWPSSLRGQPWCQGTARIFKFTKPSTNLPEPKAPNRQGFEFLRKNPKCVKLGRVMQEDIGRCNEGMKFLMVPIDIISIWSATMTFQSCPCLVLEGFNSEMATSGSPPMLVSWSSRSSKSKYLGAKRQLVVMVGCMIHSQAGEMRTIRD